MLVTSHLASYLAVELDGQHESCGVPSLGHQLLDQLGGGGRVDSAFDSCLNDTGSNPAEAGHFVITVG